MQQKFTHCYARRSLMALLWLLLPCIYLHAQKSVQPGRNVTITNGHISLRDVFNVIEKQTGVILFFGDLNTNQHVTVRFVSTPIEEALAEMLPPLGLTYEYVKGNKDKIFIRSIVADKKKDTVMVMSVSGVVTDDKGAPLPGASVRIKGTLIGTATKENGSFTLNRAGEKDVIQVSYTGFVMTEMSLAGKTDVKVRLKPGDNSLNETVVTAYGTSTQRALTGAITVVKGEQIQTLPNRSFDKSLQGLVPGLVVTSGNGQPGSAPSNFLLRGIATGGSVTGGGTVRNPLVVIDGIPVSQEPTMSEVSDNTSAISNPMAQINPSDIESISVLKDAAAIALYGSKASNGVILVTTKTGKAGKTVFNFRHQSDLSSRLKGKVNMLNEKEYFELLKDAYHNSNPGITDAEILSDLRSVPSPLEPKFPTFINSSGDTSFYSQDNWSEKLYRPVAITTTNELSISGGNERSVFFIGMEYSKQNGVARKSGYDRKSLRFNFEIRPSTWFRLGLNTMLSYNIQNYSGEGVFNLIERVSPLAPIYNDDGSFRYNYLWGMAGAGNSLVPNPIAATELNIKKNTAYRGLSKIYGEIKVLKNISFNSALGVDYMLNENIDKIHPLLAIDGVLDYEGRIKETNYRTANIITTNTLQFNQTLRNDHTIHILLGQEAQIKTSKISNIIGYGFANNPLLDQTTGATTIFAGNTNYRQTLLSYFGQLNYSYRNKYYASGSIRADGASNFGKNERFGTYWSVGSGWLISEEPFMKPIRNWVSFLKLRGSFGAAGNSAAIADYFRYDYLNMLNYPEGIAVMQRTDIGPGNPSIKWEETFSWDAGLEFKLLGDRVFFSADVYNRKTKNLIASSIPLPLATGFDKITDNIGNITNKGIELSISAEIVRSKRFFWRINANWSRNQNKFTKSFFNETSDNNATANNYLINRVGVEYNSFYLPVWAGVNPENGRPMWIDSLGKKSEDYYSAKREIVGSPLPDGFGSVTNTLGWKGIELSFNIYYSYGSKIYFNSSFMQNDGLDPYVNQNKSALNRWKKPGDVSINPRRLLYGMVGGEQDLGTNESTRYLVDGDYIRLANVSIGYVFSNDLIRNLRVTGIRVFLQGHNLATITKYSGQDPDNVNVFGVGNFLYPQQRTYSAGLMVSF